MATKDRKRVRRELGAGYYHPDAVTARIKRAEKKGRTARAKVLHALLLEIRSLPPVNKLTKSWRSIPYREMRYRQMKEMRKTMTLNQIGRHFELSRERVRQILSNRRNGA
jgi:DNA-directed RNA polymerase sigma subunit (sigma70/sigma32)